MSDSKTAIGVSREQVEAALADPTLASLRQSGAPVLVIAGDPASVVYANGAASALFGGDLQALTRRLLHGGEPGALRIAALSRSLLPGASPRLERLRFFFGPLAETITILCRRFAVESGAPLFALAAPGMRAALPTPDADGGWASLFVAPSENDNADLSGELQKQRQGAGDHSAARATSVASLALSAKSDTDGASAAIKPLSANPALTSTGHPSLAAPSAAAQSPKLVESAFSLREKSQPPKSAPPEKALLHPATRALLYPDSASESAVSQPMSDKSAVGKDEAVVSPPSAPSRAFSQTPENGLQVGAADAKAISPATPSTILASRVTRFAWRTDGDHVFTAISPGFLALVGVSEKDFLGHSFIALVNNLALDTGGRLIASLASRDTWSDVRVLWPIEHGALFAPVTLGGAPELDANRLFAGYRGFALVHAERIAATPGQVAEKASAADAREEGALMTRGASDGEGVSDHAFSRQNGDMRIDENAPVAPNAATPLARASLGADDHQTSMPQAIAMRRLEDAAKQESAEQPEGDAKLMDAAHPENPAHPQFVEPQEMLRRQETAQWPFDDTGAQERAIWRAARPDEPPLVLPSLSALSQQRADYDKALKESALKELKPAPAAQNAAMIQAEDQERRSFADKEALPRAHHSETTQNLAAQDFEAQTSEITGGEHETAMAATIGRDANPGLADDSERRQSPVEEECSLKRPGFLSDHDNQHDKQPSGDQAEPETMPDAGKSEAIQSDVVKSDAQKMLFVDDESAEATIPAIGGEDNKEQSGSAGQEASQPMSQKPSEEKTRIAQADALAEKIRPSAADEDDNLNKIVALYPRPNTPSQPEPLSPSEQPNLPERPLHSSHEAQKGTSRELLQEPSKEPSKEPLMAPQTRRAPSRPELSAVEKNAFRDIARALGVEPSADVQPQTPSAERDPLMDGESGAFSSDRGFSSTKVQRARDLIDLVSRFGQTDQDENTSNNADALMQDKAPSPANAPQRARDALEQRLRDDSALSAQQAALSRNASAIIEHMPVGIIIIQDDTALYVNRTLLDLLDFSDIATLQAAGPVARLFSGVPPTKSGDVRIETRDGEALIVDARVQEIEWEGAPVTMVTLRRSVDQGDAARVNALELDLRQRDEDMRNMRQSLDIAADGIIIIDAAGRILSLNASGGRLFGYDANEVAGELIDLVIAKESQADFSDYFSDFQQTATGLEQTQARGQNHGRELIGRTRDGVTMPLLATLMRMGRAASDMSDQGGVADVGEPAAIPREKLGGDAAKFCLVLRNLTSWKKAEGALGDARRDAERASDLKSQFLAKVSHEIRTPLNAILGFTEVMLDERFGPVGNERYREYMKDIHRSGEHVMSLVNDLLDLSKIEAGKMDLTFVSVDANAVVSECVSLMHPQANRNRIVMRLSLAPNLPNIVADERSIRQIVLNLLSNALKFNEAGGQVIVSTALTDSGYAIIRIKDTGVGMSEEDIEIALEPFRQLASARQNEGTGLGLPLTKALVEANRATFTITSRKNEGTLAEVMFPPTRVLAE